MLDHWITTHWPIPLCDPPFSRHVYVKGRHVSLPKPGDMVFIRETIAARVRTVARHHLGNKTKFDVPRGTGGIIGTAIVDGTLRRQQPEDVVFDFGDLDEWMVIPCREFRPARLPLKDLKRILDRKNLQFLHLWKCSNDGLAEKLLKEIRQ